MNPLRRSWLKKSSGDHLCQTEPIFIFEISISKPANFLKPLGQCWVNTFNSMLQSMFLWIINLIFHIYSNSCAVLDLRPTARLSRFTRSAPRQATRKVMTMHHFAWCGTMLTCSRSCKRDSRTCLLIRIPPPPPNMILTNPLGHGLLWYF